MSNDCIDHLAWLALESSSPRATVDFYDRLVGFPVADSESLPGPEGLVAFRVGGGVLEFRSPETEPRGGRHTHFAVAINPSGYDPLLERFERHGRVTERRFDGHRSMYMLDPAGHVVEFGERPAVEAAYGDIFEVVFEVADRERAAQRYRRLGFETVDRGTDRPRIRMRGPFDLELWEPHRGIGGGRGGAGVELGLVTADPVAALDALGVAVSEADERGDGLEWVDPDGHRLVFIPPTDDAEPT